MSQQRQNSRKDNLVHLTPGCREETLDTAGKVFFIDTIEETNWQEQLIS